MTDAISNTPADAPAGVPNVAPVEQRAPLDAPPANPTAPVERQTATNAQSAASEQVQANLATEAANAEAAAAPSQTGNAAFDQVAKLLASKGLTNTNAILNEASSEGGLSLASKADLVEKLGAEVADLVINQMSNEVKATQDSAKAEGDRLMGYAAQKLGATPEQAAEAWEVLKNFSTSEEAKFTPADRKALSAMLDAGGSTAEFALNELSNRYQNSQGFTQAPTLISGDGATQSGFEPLSKGGYSEQISKVTAQYGYDSREAESLRQRRSLSMQRGY